MLKDSLSKENYNNTKIPNSIKIVRLLIQNSPIIFTVEKKNYNYKIMVYYKIRFSLILFKEKKCHKI